MAQDDKHSVQSVDRALVLLDTLSEKPDGCSIKYLSETTGLHKSTVHRIIHTMMRHGYVRQDPETEHYFVGLKVLEISNSLLGNMDIHTIAKPFLQNLHRRTAQVIHLFIRNEGDAVYVDKIENPNVSVRMYSQVGKTVPLYCSSSGKALLAWLPEEQIRKAISKMEFTRFTPTTVQDGLELMEQLTETRQKGYASDWFEHEDNVCCIAAPIMDSFGQPIAAISLAGTVLQIVPDNYMELARKVNETAFQISKHMGCRDYPAIFSQQLCRKDVQRLEEFISNKVVPSFMNNSH